MSDERDLILFRGHLLNEEIEQAKSLFLRKSEEFALLIRGRQANPSYSNLPRDELGTSLIPEDVTDAGNQLVALKSKPNGDCLFNAVSITLFGNDTRSLLLRLLVAGELYFNRSFYADHDVFKDTTASDPELYPNILFSVALTRRGDRKFSETGSRDDTLKEEAFVACEIGQWSSLVHIMGMSSVLSKPIVSMYPTVQFKYRCLVNRIINPRASDTSVMPNEEAINILWSRDGNLDNRAGTWYTPNHFVPVVRAEPSASDKQDYPPTSKSSTPQQKHQGTLFSFLKPKASAIPAKKPQDLKRKTSDAGHNNKKLKEGADVKRSTSTSAALKKKVMFKWKDEFPWLTIREEDDAVLCSVCVEAPKEAGNTQFITGCKSDKKETMRIHAGSNGHLRAQRALLAQKKPIHETILAQSFSKATKDLAERDRREVAIKMTTAYFIAKEELPFSKFNALIALQKKNGLELTSTYANDKTCTQMVSVLGKLSKEGLAAEIKNKHFISVMADGATDVGGTENETVFCRFVRDGRPVNRLIGHKAVEHANAEGKRNNTFVHLLSLQESVYWCTYSLLRCCSLSKEVTI